MLAIWYPTRPARQMASAAITAIRTNSNPPPPLDLEPATAPASEAVGLAVGWPVEGLLVGTGVGTGGAAVTAGVGFALGSGVVPAIGVTAFDFAEVAPNPAPFLALTVNVYDVPSVSPPRVQLNAPVVAQVLPPGADVTV